MQLLKEPKNHNNRYNLYICLIFALLFYFTTSFLTKVCVCSITHEFYEAPEDFFYCTNPYILQLDNKPPFYRYFNYIYIFTTIFTVKIIFSRLGTYQQKKVFFSLVITIVIIIIHTLFSNVLVSSSINFLVNQQLFFTINHNENYTKIFSVFLNHLFFLQKQYFQHKKKVWFYKHNVQYYKYTGLFYNNLVNCASFLSSTSNIQKALAVLFCNFS